MAALFSGAVMRSRPGGAEAKFYVSDTDCSKCVSPVIRLLPSLSCQMITSEAAGGASRESALSDLRERVKA